MPRLATVLLLVFALAGCGGGGGSDDGKPDRLTLTTPKRGEGDAKLEPGGSPARPRTGPVTKAEEAVIRGWADALRRGDLERAVRYWAVPAIAANGNQPFRLVTRPAVREFNAGLTCGARLESVERDQNYVLATFVLTNRRDRPGACAQGVGNRARTLFLLRGGKIVQWIRATDPPSGSSSS